MALGSSCKAASSVGTCKPQASSLQLEKMWSVVMNCGLFLVSLGYRCKSCNSAGSMLDLVSVLYGCHVKECLFFMDAMLRWGCNGFDIVDSADDNKHSPAMSSFVHFITGFCRFRCIGNTSASGNGTCRMWNRCQPSWYYASI